MSDPIEVTLPTATTEQITSLQSSLDKQEMVIKAVNDTANATTDKIQTLNQQNIGNVLSAIQETSVASKKQSTNLIYAMGALAILFFLFNRKGKGMKI